MTADEKILNFVFYAFLITIKKAATTKNTVIFINFAFFTVHNKKTTTSREVAALIFNQLFNYISNNPSINTEMMNAM